MFNFQYGLHQAVLLGKKTVTRREGGLKVINGKPDEWQFSGITQKKVTFESGDGEIDIPIHYKVGEDVYIKEPVMDLTALNTITGKGYQALYQYPTIGVRGGTHKSPGSKTAKEFLRSGLIKWTNKMFMSPDHARHFIRITSVRVERANDITESDAIREGVLSRRDVNTYPVSFLGYDTIVDQCRSMKLFERAENKFVYYEQVPYTAPSAIGSFNSLLRLINGHSFVHKNPWVFRYEFEKLRTLQ